MDIEIVRDAEGLDDLRADWEDLEQADPEVPFYSTFAFVRGWWAAYGRDDGHELLVVTARNNGQLVGVAPLSYRPQTRFGVPIKEVRFASHGDYLSFLLHPGIRPDTVTNALLDAVFAQSDWDILNLTNIPASTTFAAALLRSEHHTLLTALSENPYIDLRPHADFAAFTADRLPSHTRKYRNKFLRETGARFRVVAGDEENILERMAGLHREERDFLRARGRRERHSLFDDARRFALYREVYARPGAARTFVYEDLEGNLLGYRSTFVHRRSLLSWNSAYHPEVELYRLGKVIQFDILEHCYAAGDVDVFDFGAGRYPWKFEWTDRSTLSYRFRYDRPALTAAAPPPRLVTGPPRPSGGRRGSGRTRRGPRRWRRHASSVPCSAPTGCVPPSRPAATRRCGACVPSCTGPARRSSTTSPTRTTRRSTWPGACGPSATDAPSSSRSPAAAPPRCCRGSTSASASRSARRTWNAAGSATCAGPCSTWGCARSTCTSWTFPTAA